MLWCVEQITFVEGSRVAVITSLYLLWCGLVATVLFGLQVLNMVSTLVRDRGLANPETTGRLLTGIAMVISASSRLATGTAMAVLSHTPRTL